MARYKRISPLPQPSPNYGSIQSNDDSESLPDSGHVQRGVTNIEAINQIWTRWSLTLAYLGWVSGPNPFSSALDDRMRPARSTFAIDLAHTSLLCLD